MKNKTMFRRKTFAAALCFSILLSLILPVVSFADDGIIYIGSTEELLELAENCSLDSYSVGKSFALTADISLEGVDFAPIPSFSGKLDGRGYTISGLNITGSYLPAGLFARLGEEGEIKNLNVSGCVNPSGDSRYVGGIVGDNRGVIENCSFIGTVIGKTDVGGIAGINRRSGQINDCTAEGDIIGDLRTGGIAGTSNGLISSCTNVANVNTVNFTPEITLTEINLSLTVDITRLPTFSFGTRSDLGGIAGYSSSMILGCNNNGQIGYPHIGYNAGGIAGRSCGHIYASNNTATVHGRKDVGGIVGQVEPYITYDLSADLLTMLKSEMDGIHDLIDKAANSIDKNSSTLTARINKIILILGNASDSIDSITSGVGQWGEETITEINRISSIAAVALDMLSDVTGLLPSLSSNMASCLKNLEMCLEEMKDVSEISREMLVDLELCLEDMQIAIDLLSSGAESIELGIDQLADAVKVEDEEAIAEAIGLIADGSREISSSLAVLGEATSDISEIFDNISNAGDLTDSFSALGQVFGELAGAMIGLSSGVASTADGLVLLLDNISIDGDLAISGLRNIANGLSLLIDSADSLEDAIGHMRDCVDHIYNASTELDEAMVYMQAAVSDLANGTEILTEVLTAADEMVKYLAGVDAVQIPTPGNEIKTEADNLFNNISSLEGNLKSLTSEIKNTTGELTEIVREMNDSFQRMMNTTVEAIYGLSDINSGYDNDVSEEELNEVTNGKILSCKNTGSVYGDNNVGGIGGIMGQELSLDPEDDLSGEITVTERRRYKLKIAIQDCINLGEVSSKRDYAGGIVGKADMGLIYGCEVFSQGIKSEIGSYVGGIAGSSAADISSCYVKATLSGKNYVGGVLGCGLSEDLTGDSSHISRCYTIVDIDSFTQYAGAISGFDAGVYSENYFVSDSLRGIDRLSYKGKAEPISYEELTKQRRLPDFLLGFTLSFVADGQVIKTVEFEYGASFDSSVFPEIPKKAGHYGVWDITELSDLTFDTVVSVVYHRYVSAIGSEQSREDGKNIIIVEGEFRDDDTISLIQGGTDAPELKKGFFMNQKLHESWVLELPNGTSTSKIRFLSNIKKFDIYVNQNGIWTKLDTEEFGKYTIFSTLGDSVQIAVVGYSANLVTVITLSVVLLAIIGGGTALIITKRRKRLNDLLDETLYED